MIKSFQTFRNACDTSTETFGKLESLYNLALKGELTTLSESQLNDFEIIFSQKIIAFYETIPDVALTFVASFITELFKRRFSAHAKKKKKNDRYMSSLQLEPWEHVLRVIVIGLEAYSASHPQKSSQLGELLYRPLFGILSSTAGLKFSIRLKIEIFGFLSDLAESSLENRKLLRERYVLGGPRLGMLISYTNEYLVLVILLQLLESMISDNEDEDAVMDIGKDVFQNLKIKRSLKQASPKLIKILQEAGNTAWDLTADRLIHAMATDGEKPKPFLLASSQIRANDKTFSHPEMLRHIYMDNGAFIVNVEDEGGIDCLDIGFKSMVSMSFREIPVSSKAEISLSLSSPPMMATEAVPSKTSSYAVIFDINLADLEKFKDALKIRGLDKLVKGVAPRPRAKQSVASQPLNLNNISCISLEEKSLAVEQFYRTNTPEPMVSHKGAIREETDMTAFTSNIKSTSSPPNHLIDKECLRPLNFAHEVQASVGGLLANNHGNYNEPKTLQNSDKLAKDAHRSMLKRKRNTAEVDGSNSKSKSNENHYYNSQLLTKKAPISTKKYKARRRVLSSAESSSFEDDMIPPASPVRINDFKPLIKLNTDRPDRLILPTASKTERKTLKAVPTDPSILGKPRPKPKPKRRKVIEESDSDEFEEPPVLLKKTPNEKTTITKPISPENQPYTAAENDMNVYKSPTPQTTIVEKPAIAMPIVVEASSPFKVKDSELGFLNDEEPAQDVEMDISEKLNAFNDSDRDDDDKSILPLRAKRHVQDSVNVGLTLGHELPRAQTKISHTETKVMPPLKSALKSVSRSESSVIDLTHLADSPKKNVGKLLECVPEAQIQFKSYPVHNTLDNNDFDMRLTDTSNTSRITAQLPTVTFKEYPEKIKDRSIDVFSGHFVSGLEANKDPHSTRLPPTPPFENASRRTCKETRCASQIIDNCAPRSKGSKFVSEDVESSSLQEGILTPEQRLVNVLNRIHETIVENLGKKIKGTSTTGNAISRKFRLYAAEELEKMLQESIKHRQNMVVLEHKYGTYHKNLKVGLEEIRKSNQEIKKTLEQVVQDHDTLSLVRKMPARLAPRPKFL